jgi:heptosyltransferase-3
VNPISLQNVSKVLVVKLGHLGDVVLAAPVVSVLKRRAPHAEIDALVYADTASMLTGHPGLSRLFTINGAELKLLWMLRKRRYDLLVALSDRPRIAWLARLIGVRYAVSPQRVDRPGLWRRSFTHFYALPPGNSRHTVEVHLDALRALGVDVADDERSIVLVPGREAERRIDALALPKRFIVVHPASRWLFKCWTAARTAELVDTLQARGERVVLTGSADPEENALVEDIVRRLRAPALNLAGRLSLKELAALIGRAALFVGVDSAPMHMASAMGTPAVALFGPSGEVEWGPWQIPHRVIVSGHACRPCGYNGCGGGNRSECIETIPVRAVLQAVDELAHAT